MKINKTKPIVDIYNMSEQEILNEISDDIQQGFTEQILSLSSLKIKKRQDKK